MDLVVLADGDKQGSLLSDFIPRGQFQSKISRSRRSLLEAYDTSNHSKLTPVASDNKNGQQKYERPGEFVVPIQRVSSNDKDTLRALYLTEDSPFPDFLCSHVVNPTDRYYYDNRQQQGRNMRLFQLMDAGNYIHWERSRIKEIHKYLGENELKLAHPTYQKRETVADTRYIQELTEHKRMYIDRFLAGEVDRAAISIFVAEGRKLYYSDSVIEVVNQEDMDKVSKDLLHYNGADFTEAMRHILRTSKGVPIEVNGTRIKYESRDNANGTLHYVNDKRIAKDDVFPVINRVTCYPNGTAQYQQFVDMVCKISMKYHKAINEGIPLIFSTYDFQYIEKLDTEVKIPVIGSGGHGNTYRAENDLDCKLRIRKRPGKKAEVFLLDEWHKIDKFDMFVDRCRYPNASNRRNTGTTYRLNDKFEDDKKDKKDFGNYNRLIRRLCILDQYLVESDRIIVGKYAPVEGSSYYSQTIGNTKEEVKEIQDICKKIVKDLKVDMSDALKKIERSRELLEDVMKRTKATKETKGHGDVYYCVTGASGNHYKVRESDAAVIQGDRHICIVNAGTSDMAGYDYIASLLVALANDKRTARDIYTLQGLGNLAEAG
jgi:hypothetical protein